MPSCWAMIVLAMSHCGPARRCGRGSDTPSPDTRASGGKQGQPAALGARFGLFIGRVGGEPTDLRFGASAEQPTSLASEHLGACGVTLVERYLRQVAVDGIDALGQVLDLGLCCSDILLQGSQVGARLRRLPTRVLGGRPTGGLGL